MLIQIKYKFITMSSFYKYEQLSNELIMLVKKKNTPKKNTMNSW